MNISVFGLGYVGIVTSAILSKKHKVIGVDVNPTKVSIMNQGRSPIIEEGVSELVKKGIKSKRLKATSDPKYAVMNTDVSVICVGTPSEESGGHDLSYLNNVMEEISELLKEKKKYHLIVIRSTVTPGTSLEMKEKYFQGMNVGLCFNPEFLREGVAVKDYINPPFIIVACTDKKAVKLMKEFYKGIKSEFIVAPFQEAETVKMLCNVFHAYKIVFANEVGRFSEAYGVSGKRLMSLLCRDKKLNISSKYLIPGFAYGGSCLPKDLRNLQYLARKKDLDLPVINSLDISNEKHIHNAIRKIESFDVRSVGFVGLSFKPGTDDLRESPQVRLVEYFIGKGYDVKIFDKDVSLAKLMGANKAYIEKEIPHISSLLVDRLDELDECKTIVLNRNVKKDFSNRNVVDLR